MGINNYSHANISAIKTTHWVHEFIKRIKYYPPLNQKSLAPLSQFMEGEEKNMKKWNFGWQWPDVLESLFPGKMVGVVHY